MYDSAEYYEHFQRQWFEVEMLTYKNYLQGNYPAFLHPDLDLNSKNKATMYDREKGSYRKHTIDDMRGNFFCNLYHLGKRHSELVTASSSRSCVGFQ